MLKHSFISLMLCSLLFCCSSQRSMSFLYKGNFFNKSFSSLNYPYQLTTDTASEFSPAISPDGKYIVYVSDKTGNLDLWLYDILNRESFQITYHTSDDTMPCFSANGKKIIFISFRNNGIGDIYKMDFSDILDRAKPGLAEDVIKSLLKDDGAHPVTLGRIPKSEPVYIDNKYLYYVQPDKDGLINIFKTKDKLNAKFEQITYKGAVSPAISPDKKLLAYIDISAEPGPHGHLSLLNPAAGTKRQIIFGLSFETKPFFVDNNTLLFSSARFDSNKDGKIDVNDNGVLYLFDLKTGKQKQITPDNYTSYYPKYSSIYNGVIIYTSNILDNIGLWMLSAGGYFPDTPNSGQQISLIESIDDDYLKLIGYKNLLNYKNVNADAVNLKIADVYFRLNYSSLALSYLSNIIHVPARYSPEEIEAKLSLILNSSLEREVISGRAEALKNSIKTNILLLCLVNYKLSKYYLENKETKNALNLLESIVQTYTNKDGFLFDSIVNLSELSLQYRQFSKAEKYAPLVLPFRDYNKKISFINRFFKLYIKSAAAVNPQSVYKDLLEKFKNIPDFYYGILFHYGLSFKTQKEAVEILTQTSSASNQPYFKIKALEQLYLITKDEKYLGSIINFPKSENNDIREIVQRAKDILINRNLSSGQENYNYNNFLLARNDFEKAADIDSQNIPALTGSLRSEFQLTPADEKKYQQLIQKYDGLLEKDIYNFTYYYLKGYGYSLIYASYHLKYTMAFKKGEQGLFIKFIDLFKKQPPYTSYYRNLADKYYKLSEENLQTAYRLKPGFLPAYLTLGWLYQVHSEIDKEHLTEYIENSVPLYHSALHFNDEEKDPGMESALCLNLANIYFNLKNYSQAFQFYNKKLDHSIAFENKAQESFFYYHLAYASWFLGRDDMALKNFNRAHDLFMSLGEYYGAYNCLLFMAMDNRVNENYFEALNYYFKALDLIEKYKLQTIRERVIRELGICYNNLQNPQTAMSYYNEAARIMPEEKKEWWFTVWLNRPGIRLHIIDNTALTVWGLNIDIGKSFAYRGFNNRDEKKLIYALISDTYAQFLNYKKAVEYMLLKKELLVKDKNAGALSYVNNNLGMLYFKLNDLNSAKQCFMESIKLLNKETVKNEKGEKVPKDPLGIAVNNLNLAELLLKQQGESPIMEVIKEAAPLLDKAVEISQKNKYSESLIKANSLYGALYFTKALQNNPASVNMKDPYNSIRHSYDDFLTSLKYYKDGLRTASSEKFSYDVPFINYNIGLIYYYTGDMGTALDTFQQTGLDAKKYFIHDLRWKCEYYILKLNRMMLNKKMQEIDYPAIIRQIEEAFKGYNYNPVDDPLTDIIYNEYIDALLKENKFHEALKYSEKKKNFKIKEIFLSTPFELRTGDNEFVKKMRDIENQAILTLKRAQAELFVKFDINKRNELEIKLKELYTQKSNLTAAGLVNNPELVYYTYKNEINFTNKIKNLPDKNLILAMNLYRSNLNLWIIAASGVTFRQFPVDDDFRRNILLINNNLAENKDNSSLINYFNKKLFIEVNRIIKRYEQVTLIPDDTLFSFPFSLFLKEKQLNYDISLSQFFFNIEKIPFTRLKTTVLDTGSSLNKILPGSVNPFPKKKVPLSVFAGIFFNSRIVHEVNGFSFDLNNPVKYDLIYNEDYNMEINNLLGNNFKGELVSFENLPKNFLISERNIYSLLIPLYYTGVPSVSFNLWPVKEKINFNFWNNYYNYKKMKLSERFALSSARLFADTGNYSRSYFKALYGNFGLDKEYKLELLKKRQDSLNQSIQSDINVTNKIEYYSGLLRNQEEIKTILTNYWFDKKNIHTNLLSLSIRVKDYQGALGILNEMILNETDLIQKQLYRKEYSNIYDLSQMTNNNPEQLNSIIEAGDSYYTNKNYKKAVNEYKKAMDYLDKSLLKGYAGGIIYKIVLSYIGEDELSGGLIWMEKAFQLPDQEINPGFRHKFDLLHARMDLLNKDYEAALSALTNIKKKDKEYYLIKTEVFLKRELPETTKYSQINFMITNEVIKLSDKALKEIFNLVIDHFKDSETIGINLYSLVNLYKNNKLPAPLDLGAIQAALDVNSLFIDFYISKENIYSFIITRSNIRRNEIKLKKYTPLFREYYKGLLSNNEEEFNSVNNSLSGLLFGKIEKELISYSNIILCPDETLYFINYYGFNNPARVSNQDLRIIRPYNALTNHNKQSFIFQGYGVQKNLSGKVVTDFSYKEVKELKNNFKDSITEINPREININRSINSLHLGMPVIFNNTNISISLENGEKEYSADGLLKDKFLTLLLLTKAEYRGFNGGLITGLNTEYLILSLNRNNDGLSAVFMRDFYSSLSFTGSVRQAYKKALQKMRYAYKNSFQGNNFILIE